MPANWLVATASFIVLAMGTGHLLLTLFSPAFEPRDPSVKLAMEGVATRFDSRMNLWRSWIGFNLSHSMGPMILGTVYAYLSLTQGMEFFHSYFLPGFGAVILIGYILVARAYWFILPLTGLLIATAVYLAGLAVAYL